MQPLLADVGGNLSKRGGAFSKAEDDSIRSSCSFNNVCM